jgi:undecaprenyl-diphosphatase
MSGKSGRPGQLTGGIDRPSALVAAVAALLFVVLTIAVALSPGPLPFDRPIALAIQSVHSDVFTPFNSFVAALNGTTAIMVGAAIIVLTFLFRRSATLLVAFSALYSLIYNGVDVLLHRPRPTGLPHNATNLGAYSFPSGHVGFFIWIMVLTVVILARDLPRAWFRVAWVVAAILVILAGLSRIYVGAHWPSDVIGGLLVGVGWMAFSLSIGRLTRPIFGNATSGQILRGVATAPSVND